MSFASAPFLFFLAFGLWLYAAVPEKRRGLTLLTLGLIWYATWNWKWPMLMIGVTAANYLVLKLQERSVKIAGRWFFISLLMVDFGVLVIAKLYDRAPFGFSFFSFMLAAFIIDVWRGSLRERPKSFGDFLLSFSFFPFLMSGPIERYNHIGPQLNNLQKLNFKYICDGILVFAYGFLKYYFLSEPLDHLAGALFEPRNLSVPALVLGGLVKTLQAYVEFSSYCDMGRGAAKCFGIDLLPNFRPIYYARDPNDFWLRWNITLGTWVRDYVSFPAMLHFGRWMSNYAVIMIAYFIVGLWHGFSMNWILFGLFNGVLISIFLGARRSVFLRRPKAAKVWGIILVWLMLVGNGILQDAHAWSLLERVVNPLRLRDRAPLDLAMAQMSILAPYLCVLAIVDFWQEKTGDLDFYLRFAMLWRVSGALVFVWWFLTALSGGSLLHLEPLPPVYFRF